MANIIIGNILSFLASLCSLTSTRMKTYKQTMLVQTLDASLFALSNLVLEGYSGVVVNLCEAIRNLYCVFGKQNKIIIYTFIVISFIISIIFRDKTWYGFIPIIASTIYGVVILNTDDVKKVKIALIINVILWSIYSIIILDVVGVIFKTIMLVSTIQSLVYMHKFDESREI